MFPSAYFQGVTMSEKIKGFKAAYGKFEDVFSEIMMSLCVIIFAVMVFSVSYGVLGRYLTFVKSPRWTQELAILCLVWLCFVSAGYAIRTDKHVRMSVIDRIVPESWVKYFHLGAYVFLVLVNLFLVIYGLKLVSLSSSAKMAATGWPLNITYYSVVIGGLYGFFMALGRIIKGVN